jgi:alpha-glucosidase
MRRVRLAPKPGVTAGVQPSLQRQPRRRYSFKLLWDDRQLWFTPQGFSPVSPARLEQFAVDSLTMGRSG